MNALKPRASNEVPVALFSATTAYRLVPWGWSAAWLLTGAGIWLSDVTSSPSNSLFAYYILSAIGWGIAILITVRTSWEKPGRGLRLAAWVVASWVAVFFGLVWMRSWNVGYMGLRVAIGIAGGIGGMASSSRTGLGRLISGILLGGLFFVFAVASFYGTYFCLVLVTWFAQRYGDVPIFPILEGLSWMIPGALFGLGAGLAVRWSLRLRPVAS